MMTNLCQFGKGCFGCCGHNFGSRENIMKSIKENTKEFNKIKNIKKFHERTDMYLDLNGLCPHIVMIKNKIICPLHPTIHGKDKRIGECDTKYLCETIKNFNSWNTKKKKEFIDFIKSNKPDFYDYSIKMDNGKLLKSFLKNKERNV